MKNKIYSTRDQLKLRKSLCKDCYSKINSWDDDVFLAWSKYINGENRNTIHIGTKYSSFSGLKHQFRKHPCQPKISSLRKKFKLVKTQVEDKIIKHPWLLGLYFADGCIKNKSQLSFALSMHEELIEDKVSKELKKILGNNAHVAREFVGNMRIIRTHSIELCDQFPTKNPNGFSTLWTNFSKEEKLLFIAGFIDGDGSCAFDVGINAIQIFSKDFPYALNSFQELLSQYGYASLRDVGTGKMLYLSPNIGKIIKHYTIKKDIKRPYHGAVDTEKAFEMLSKGQSIYRISKILEFNKKTVHLALKQVYGIEQIKIYTDKTRKEKFKSKDDSS